jgi:hypothetical protein
MTRANMLKFKAPLGVVTGMSTQRTQMITGTIVRESVKATFINVEN